MNAARRGLHIAIYSVAVSFVCLCAVAIVGRNAELRAESAACSTKPLSSATFLKTFHLRDNTRGHGLFPTKDGGYLLIGDTIMSNALANPNPFAVKTDAKGNVAWTRLFSSQIGSYSISSSRHIGRFATEMPDGSFILVSDTGDFVDAAYEKVMEEGGDILVTKLNAKGGRVWSIMIGDYSLDLPQKAWALPDGGVIILARFMETGHGTDIADISAVPKNSVLTTIDKNGVVRSVKKMPWNAIGMERLSDGGFIALAGIAIPKTEQPEGIIGPEIALGDLPTMIRLDSQLKVVWAKSMEMIPSEISTLQSINGSDFTMGITKVRMMGGDFMSIQPAPDGGFIAFGYANVIATTGMSGTVGPLTQNDLRSYVAVKVNATGTYQWTKKVTSSLGPGTTAHDFHVVRTADNGFVILLDVVRDSNWPTYYANGDAKALEQAWATNIELLKTDADFNPMWIKKIDVERDLSGYDIRPTADKGVVVTGNVVTTKQRMVMGSLEPYVEAMLMKVDVNGGVRGCAAVSDHPEATVEDQSSYLIMQDMDVGDVAAETLNVNKKVSEKVTTTKNTARAICQYAKNSVTPSCSTITSDAGVSQSGATSTAPVAKTWALINYENAKECPIESEKNRQIHDELLPILKQAFNDQVKMTDSMNSMWLTYYFPRLVTRADVEAVQKYYEGLGYKIDESEGGTLYVSRVGLTLHMTFSITNPMKGKLEVLF